MTAAQIIDAVIAQCGTDASRAVVLSMLNEQYAAQVADARWMRTVAQIGTTAIGQSQYPVPVSVVEAYGVQVGGIPYSSIGDDALWRVRASQSSLVYGNGGVFAQTYDSSGVLVLDLQPIPETAGAAITMAASVLPTALTDGSNAPITPVDIHSSLIDGTAALIFQRVDERPDLAGPFQSRFDQATEKLRRRRNAQLNGSGPMQALVAGKHF